MPLYSSSYLKSLATKRRGDLTKAYSINESIGEDREFDIFLSHSFLDKEEVNGLYIELSDLGFTVYVDWMVDPHLDRENITKASATKIRMRLRSSKSLLLAISANAAISKWMPWELGFMDGDKSKCAIIPVSHSLKSVSTYKGFEYLSLYPFIKKTPTRDTLERLFVVEEAQKYVLFEDWVKNNVQPQKQEINIDPW